MFPVDVFFSDFIFAFIQYTILKEKDSFFAFFMCLISFFSLILDLLCLFLCLLCFLFMSFFILILDFFCGCSVHYPKREGFFLCIFLFVLYLFYCQDRIFAIFARCSIQGKTISLIHSCFIFLFFLILFFSSRYAYSVEFLRNYKK